MKLLRLIELSFNFVKCGKPGNDILLPGFLFY